MKNIVSIIFWRHFHNKYLLVKFFLLLLMSKNVILWWIQIKTSNNFPSKICYESIYSENIINVTFLIFNKICCWSKIITFFFSNAIKHNKT